MATTVNCVPSVEISCPMNSSLKSRLSRSGVTSTRILPGMGESLGGGWPAEVPQGDIPGRRPVRRPQQRIAAPVAEHHGAAEEPAVGAEEELHQGGDLLGPSGPP